MTLSAAAKRLALLACLLPLAPRAISAQGLQVVDFSDESLLNGSESQGGTAFGLFKDSHCLVQLVRRDSGMKSPPHKLRSADFIYFLNDAAFAQAQHPDKLVKIKTGDALLEPTPHARGGITVTSAQPLERIIVYSPPLDTVGLAPGEAPSNPGPKAFQANVLNRLRSMSPQGGVKPLFPANPSRIHVDVIDVRKALVTNTPSSHEYIWIPVEGQARLESGDQTEIAKPNTVVRVPAGYALPIKVTPLGSRFATLVIAVP